MKILGAALLIGVGFLNLAPVVGFISPQQPEARYGIGALAEDLEVQGQLDRIYFLDKF